MEFINPYGVKIANIRTCQHNGQTHYSVHDVLRQLSKNGTRQVYWSDFKKKNSWVSDYVFKLDIPSRSLYQEPTDCANAEGILMIIAYFPKSPKYLAVIRAMAKTFSDKLKQTKGTSLVKFIESIE